MLEIGIIDLSYSLWSSPGNGRTAPFVIDYRGLNAVTKKDIYPVPHVEDALDSFFAELSTSPS